MKDKQARETIKQLLETTRKQQLRIEELQGSKASRFSVDDTNSFVNAILDYLKVTPVRLNVPVNIVLKKSGSK